MRFSNKTRQTYSGTACFTEAEFQAIRHAHQTGRLSGCLSFSSKRLSLTQRELTLNSRNPRLLCQQLESLIDFGATTAGEVLFDVHRELFSYGA